MKKINVVLVMLNANGLKNALISLNFSRANLVAVVIENGNGKFININDKEIPCLSFSQIQTLLGKKNFAWLLCGWVNYTSDLWKMKKFLMNSGVPEDDIVNFEINSYISIEWLANLRYIEKHGAEFFATGISYTMDGLDLQYVSRRGVNLACSNQDLSQGYQIAKYVFKHVKPGTIKFVIIGLAPYSFRYDNAKSFTVCTRNLQYMLALDTPARNNHDRLLQILVSNRIKNLVASIKAEQADLNFDRKKNSHFELPANSVIDWEMELKNLTKKLFPDTVEKNFQILKDYIKLCLDNGAKPIGVVFPFAPIMWKNYSLELLTLFRLMIRQLEESYDFPCVDLFDLELDYDCFYNMAHLNLRGAAISSAILNLRLYEEKLFAIEKLCAMSYEYFNLLSNVLPKESYNTLLERVFAQSVQMLRRKNKLRVGFVTDNAAMWCGDELYNYFAQDDRFEPTVFLCLRMERRSEELIIKDFHHGVEQFKSRGLNVFAISNPNTEIPEQDILIYLRPYMYHYPVALRLSSISARTLVVNISYGFHIALSYNNYNIEIFHTAWRVFFESNKILDLFDKHFCSTGMPRGIFSGYTRQDPFFEDTSKLRFNWKIARRNAKKIVWAPHWSINDGVRYATFQWNYKFMYEYAKAHPEISWVVKPHPNLLFSAVESGVFPSTAAFEEYLKAWNDLPNAQVYTGAYYQDLFATSDGMIHDSGSFIAEYQYTGKPMIFLTREGEKFNELGKGILNVSYLVDGRDLNSIAALMQKIFIEGNDPKRVERKKFFDEHLNYYKQNGMLASKFIYRNIAQELQG